MPVVNVSSWKIAGQLPIGQVEYDVMLDGNVDKKIYRIDYQWRELNGEIWLIE